MLPLSSLAGELESKGFNSDIVIDRSPIAQTIAKREFGTSSRIIRIRCGKFRRYAGRSWSERMTDFPTFLLNLRDGIFIIIGQFQALYHLIKRRPETVFINGGAVGVPVAIAARILRIPYLVHESDVLPGLANKLIIPRASRVLYGLAVPHQFTNSSRHIFTGIPTRTTFVEAKGQSSTKLRTKYQFKSGVPIILVTGGSQGSKQLNDAVLALAHELTSRAQIIHLTGVKHVSAVAEEISAKGIDPTTYRVYGYVDEAMPEYLRMADIVISRSGATILSDLAFMGKAVILVPNPYLARHQVVNANLFVQSGAALIVNQDSSRQFPEQLLNAVNHLLDSREDRLQLERSIAKFAQTDATQRICENIIASTT